MNAVSFLYNFYPTFCFKDLSDPIALLSQKNINKDALYEYIRDACDYCTDYQVNYFSYCALFIHLL